MKIMLITQFPPPSGGIATWSKNYVNYCNENKIDLSVVNNAMIGNRGNDFHAKKSLFTELKRAFKVIKQIRDTKKEFKPDIVHFNVTCSPLGIIRDFLYTCAIGRKIPILLHCRCTIQDQLKKNKLAIYFFKKTVKRVNKVLVLNELSAIYVRQLTKKKPIKVANFIDSEYVREDAKIINEKIERIVYTGHVQVAKGCNEIIESALILPKIQFVLVGQVDDEFCQESMPSNIILLGNQTMSAVRSELDTADIFLFPSYTEGFSNSIAEAMARGLPVIASGVGANEDMIENKGGIIIPAKDSFAIVQAVKEMEALEVRKKMSEWNLKKVVDQYLIKKVMKELLSLYSESIKYMNC